MTRASTAVFIAGIWALLKRNEKCLLTDRICLISLLIKTFEVEAPSTLDFSSKWWLGLGFCCCCFCLWISLNDILALKEDLTTIVEAWFGWTVLLCNSVISMHVFNHVGSVQWQEYGPKWDTWDTLKTTAQKDKSQGADLGADGVQHSSIGITDVSLHLLLD